MLCGIASEWIKEWEQGALCQNRPSKQRRISPQTTGPNYTPLDFMTVHHGLIDLLRIRERQPEQQMLLLWLWDSAQDTNVIQETRRNNVDNATLISFNIIIKLCCSIYMKVIVYKQSFLCFLRCPIYDQSTKCWKRRWERNSNILLMKQRFSDFCLELYKNWCENLFKG